MASGIGFTVNLWYSLWSLFGSEIQVHPGITQHFRNTVGPVGSGQLYQQLHPGWGLITATLIGLRSRSKTNQLTQAHTNTVTVCCCVGPLRSSLMNIISVYRKQAFITSSRLAVRHTELHSSVHIHTRVHTVLWHTASHIFLLSLSLLLGLVQGSVSIHLASSRPTCFYFFL